VRFGRIDDTEYGIKELEIHPGYEKGIAYDDIAVITIFRDAPAFASPVCLPQEGEEVAKKLGYILEWQGETEDPESPRVMKTSRGLIGATNDDCNKLYTPGKTTKLPQGVIDDQFCTDSRARQQTCNSIAASPLVVSNKQFQWFVYGISSHREQCEKSPTYPAVYTRVEKYLDWITIVAQLD
jgi:hypothetical protein